MTPSRRAGFTYLELLIIVGLVVVALVMAVNYISRPRRNYGGVRCADNLRQIGQAMLLYANGEKNGSYPRTLYDRSGAVILTNQGFNCTDPFTPEVGTNNIGAALFLLLRTQDISSECFTCPSADSERDTFGGGTNTALNRCNFTDLAKNLSYSVANMYADTTATATGFKWNNSMSPDYAVIADRNPGLGGFNDVFRPAGPTDTATNQRYANSNNHDKDGQNVLFGEGHVEFVANPWVGVNKDHIFTRAGSSAFGPNYSPADANDSFLLPADSMIATTAPSSAPANREGRQEGGQVGNLPHGDSRPFQIVLAAAGLMVLAVIIHAMASPKKKPSPQPTGPQQDPRPRSPGGFTYWDMIVLLAMLAIVFGVFVPAAVANRASGGLYLDPPRCVVVVIVMTGLAWLIYRPVVGRRKPPRPVS